MKYVGGKFKYGREIAKIVRSHRLISQPIIEPFCGALWVTKHLYPGPVLASDINKPLITLYNAMLNGWEPPDYVSESEYDELHSNWRDGDCSPLIGFVGIGCSFGGKWFGGFTRSSDNRNYCLQAKKSLQRKLRLIRGVTLKHQNYKTLSPTNAVVYCDPPYSGTTGYRESGDQFDSKHFWNWVRQLYSQGNIVIVSEYNAPEDFKSIWSAKKTLSLGLINKGEERTEQLWVKSSS